MPEISGRPRRPERPEYPEYPEHSERPEYPERPESNRPGGYERYGDGREPGAESGRPVWAPAPTPTQPSALPPLPAGFSAPPVSPDEQHSYTPPPWSAAPTSPGHRPPPAGYVPPRRRTGRTAAAVLALVLVATGAGLGVWYLGRDHGTGTGASPAPSASASVPAPESPASPASETTPGSAVPSGYRVAHDPVGYTLDVPRGWTRRQQQGEKAPVVYYDSPSDGRQLQIFELSEATPAESLDLAENDPGYGYSRQPGYRAGDRTSGDTWAELSYRYDDKTKGARQVVDHRFQAADGTLYAIRSSGPGSLSAGLVRGPLTAAVDSFCPTDAQCS
ncbi:hypothetical protein [Streptomyces sp. NPDC048277]|uniref:hypothetical protein n=1 Tax=Streptomyces sp. NPDC048277 TaxID=3155027 RepID=UPI0033EC85BC